uniref:Peptidase M13 N-terminal domain-containing protein n=1 Tax=Dendroctonus ponderosae TaxID=77166 RepID=A0AAR5PTM1_DENPD
MWKKNSPAERPQVFCIAIRKRSNSLPDPSGWANVLPPDKSDLLRREEDEKTSSESSSGEARGIQVEFLKHENVASEMMRSNAEEYFLSRGLVNRPRSSLHTPESGPSSRPETSPQPPRRNSIPRVLRTGSVSPPAEEIQPGASRVSLQSGPHARKNLIAFAFGYPTDSHWIGSGAAPQAARTEQSHESRQECCCWNRPKYMSNVCVTATVVILFMATVCCISLYLRFIAQPVVITTIDYHEQNSIITPTYFANINTTENPCENFHLFACRSKRNRWINGDLKKPFQKHIETLISRSIKTILTMDFNKHGLPISASHKNLQAFYKACRVVHERNPTGIEKEKSHPKYWQMADPVTGWEAAGTRKGNWDVITLNAIENGFYPFVFVNLTTVTSENGEIKFKVEPSQVFNRYASVWMNIKPLMGSVSNLSLEQRPGLESVPLYKSVPMFVKSLEEMNFQNFQNITDYYVTTEVQQSVDTKLLNLLRKLTNNATLNSWNVLEFKKMVKYLVVFQRNLSRMDAAIWLTYTNIIMFLNDCRYLRTDQRQLCSEYLVGDSLLKMIDYEEYCVQATVQSPWFTGAAVANYIEYAKLEVGFDSKFSTAMNVFRNVNMTMTQWFQGDSWLSEIYKKGAKQHLGDLKISLAWRDHKFSIDSFEAIHESHTVQLSNETLFDMVHKVRRQFLIDEFNRTKLVQQRSQPALSIPEISGYVEYDRKTHTIVLGYSAIEVQRYNQLEYPSLYGSLGEWIASAMEQVFDFPELKNATCIYPHSFWKYNFLLYSSEYVKCLKRQYEDYNKIFGISDAPLDMIDLETNLPAIIGSDIAFRAYLNLPKQDYKKVYRIEVDVSLTGSQVYWLTSMVFRCGPNRLSPSFLTMAPFYTSQRFSSAFHCNESDKMVSDTKCIFAFPETFL